MFRHVKSVLARYHPREVRFRRSLAERDARYDNEYGVDTGGLTRLKKLNVSGPNRRFGISYIATPPDEFARGMAALPIRHEDFTFIDLGSGKGRALLLALDFKFRALVGVEFARELHETALANLGRHSKVELRCMDVTEFEFPDNPLVVYLYNPFGPEIMSQIARRLYSSFAASPRPIYVVYLNPFYVDPWLAAGFCVLHRGEPFVILCPAVNRGSEWPRAWDKPAP